MKYFKHKISKLIVLKNFVTMHDLKIIKDFRTKEETHNFWEFLYVESGKISIKTSAGKKIIEPGSIIFHKPGEQHSFCGEADESQIFVVSFDCTSTAMSYYENFTAQIPESLVSLMSGIISEANGTFMINTYTPPPNIPVLKERPHPNLGGEQIVKNMLESFLILLLRFNNNHSTNAPMFLSEEAFETNIVKGIKEYLKKNLCEKVRIDDICNYFGYSKTAIYNIFKKHTGKSIINYYLDLKFTYAKDQLINSNQTITKISDSLNFYSPKYFSKLFKNRFGTSPAKYRKMNKKDLQCRL